jgi:thiosulfate/3-mercaptopyruvate sulfurtransferase
MTAPFTTLIAAEALLPLIARGEALLFDCSFDLADPAAGRRAFEAGHIPGARYLDLDRDLSSAPTGTNGRHPLPDPQVLAATLRAAGLRQGAQVVAYDGSGGPYAARLWWLLRWLGHDAVAVLDGGRAAWTAAGGALESGVAADVAEGDFEPGLSLESIVSVDDVVRNLADGALLVVDARSPERFRGDPNPIDPVAGHIPGARNRFFADNLDATGRFKAPDLLVSEWRAVLGDTDPGGVVLQCGSGVTACHNALALAHAGQGGAALYPGSWSEWIASPERPVARG